MNETEAVDLKPLVMAGGNPYILISVEDPENGGVAITSHGFDGELDLAKALTEIAGLLQAEA